MNNKENQFKKKKKIIEQKTTQTRRIQKKVQSLRSKVSVLQKRKKRFTTNVSKQRSKARNILLKNLNPIIKEYMQQKKIRMVVDKKSLLLADENLDITKDIMGMLNKKLKSIKID